jgi:signal transduction histidine kinase
MQVNILLVSSNCTARRANWKGSTPNSNSGWPSGPRRWKPRAQALQQLNEELEIRIEQRTHEREQALAQLFEAQKIDTIGHLTGGVAHDFNNLLMATIGSLEILQKRLTDDPISHRLLDNAMQGAQRGAALTQRLLAFARRQELRPHAVDLAQLFAGMTDLFGRSLGPKIRILQDLPPPAARADRPQPA